MQKEHLETAIQISDLRFAWPGDLEPTLKIAHLQIHPGERIFIQGPSGSGKSTLLHLLAGVVIPQKGEVLINGSRISTLKSSERDRFRADHMGYIHQMFNLIPYLSVIENVTLPCRFSTRRKERASTPTGGFQEEAMRLLTHLGMDGAKVINKPVIELSVGQQQRVAAARALIGSPEILIADEPTSSLDADRRKAFIQLLFAECKRDKTTIIFVSHDTGLAGYFDRTIRLGDINKIV